MSKIRKVIYFVLCENFTTDIAGRASITNVFNVVGGPTLPVVGQKFVIAFSLRLLPGDIHNGKVAFTVVIRGPRNQEIQRVEGGGLVKKPKEPVASALDLSGAIKFEEIGQHSVELLVSDKKVENTVFQVRKI